MNEVFSLIVLEHSLIAVMYLSVVCPRPPIPGFGGGKVVLFPDRIFRAPLAKVVWAQD